MDKHRIFELANQLRCAENSTSIHHWFDELKKDISFEFSILGTFGEYSSLEPLCYGFSPTQFSTCFGNKRPENDPFVAAFQQSGQGIMALMDPYNHPDYGKRLLLAGQHGEKKAIFLTSFGNRHPSSDEIDTLYLLTPHLYMASDSIAHQSQQLHLPPPLNPLTDRECELLPWLKLGKSNWEISRLLNISERTVKYHLQNIYRKLETHNRTHAIAKAIELGWYKE